MNYTFSCVLIRETWIKNSFLNHHHFQVTEFSFPKLSKELEFSNFKIIWCPISKLLDLILCLKHYLGHFEVVNMVHIFKKGTNGARVFTILPLWTGSWQREFTLSHVLMKLKHFSLEGLSKLWLLALVYILGRWSNIFSSTWKT